MVTAVCLGAVVALASCADEQPSVVQPNMLVQVVDGEPLQTATNTEGDDRLQSALLTLDDGRRLEITAEVAAPVSEDCGVLRALFPNPLPALDPFTEADHCLVLAAVDREMIEEVAVLVRGPVDEPVTIGGSLTEHDEGGWVVETRADGQVWQLPLASTVAQLSRLRTGIRR